jgi:hypothetical protein
MNYVIGDVHGCGLELMALVRQIEKQDRKAKFVLVGDCFDRGMHGSTVWKLIRDYDMQVILGNHDVKMLQFISGERQYLPPHYHYFLKQMGPRVEPLIPFLVNLPLMLTLPGHIIVHGGVNVNDPLAENIDWNVYGREPKSERAPLHGWWDEYRGDDIVLYGHTTTEVDSEPRISKYRGRITSIGLDTWCVHGGTLTAYCIETKKFHRYKSGVNWFKELKRSLSEKN